jgi:hypothetical protein
LCYKYTAPSSLFSCRGIEYMLLSYFYIFPSISRHPLCVCVCVWFRWAHSRPVDRLATGARRMFVLCRVCLYSGWPLGYGFFPSKIFSPKSISEEEIKKHPADGGGLPVFLRFFSTFLWLCWPLDGHKTLPAGWPF